MSGQELTDLLDGRPLLDLSGLLAGSKKARTFYSVPRFTFPSGEPHLRLPEAAVEAIKKRHGGEVVFAGGRTAEDILRCVFACSAVRQAGGFANRLVLPFFPCARADRVDVPGDAEAAFDVVRIINDLDVDEVRVLDPHSVQVVREIDRCVVITPVELVRLAISRLGLSVVLIAPDAGACDRVRLMATQLFGPHGAVDHFAQCEKLRDPSTGKLSGFKYASKLDLVGRDVLIVDDICDGGGTFVGQAGVLREAGARTVSLCVTHGLFTKGLAPLFDTGAIDRIWTTDSCAPPDGAAYGGRFHVSSAVDLML